MSTLYPIVEGHGEVEAVPLLLRRLCQAAGEFYLKIGRPLRRHYSDLMKKDGVEKAVRLACLQPDCGSILLLFDSEDYCPKELAPTIRTWAQEAAAPIPCEVVLAYREYETWFLSAIESLRGHYGIDENAVPPLDPESRRDAKSALEGYMRQGFSYDPVVDQPRFTRQFDLAQAYRRSRSFRKMVKAFGSLMNISSPWPPTHWLD